MGKNAYKVGHWTNGTLRTLQEIQEKNAVGVKPKAKDLSSGTYRNWAYALKMGGFLTNGEGFVLTPEGEVLVAELQRHPPTEHRGIRQSELPAARRDVVSQAIDADAYRLTVEGRDIVMEAAITREQAMEVLSVISHLKKENEKKRGV